MIISVLQGGFGNQMFQYAAGRVVADRLKAPLLLDDIEYHYSDYRRADIWGFRVRARALPKAVAQALDDAPAGNALKAVIKRTSRRLIRTFQDSYTGYDPAVQSLGWFSRLSGHWQSARYFFDARESLCADLTPRAPLPPALARLAERLAEHESVAVHVRRGDLVSDPYYAETVGTLHPEYYLGALTRMRERLGNGARGYVFSDDPAWCAAHLPRLFPMEIVSGRLTRSAFEDFAAMRSCRHFVTANSTFSWWAAFLGAHEQKHVVAPSHYFRVPRPWEADMLPAGWEQVEPVFEEYHAATA